MKKQVNMIEVNNILYLKKNFHFMRFKICICKITRNNKSVNTYIKYLVQIQQTKQSFLIN